MQIELLDQHLEETTGLGETEPARDERALEGAIGVAGASDQPHDVRRRQVAVRDQHHPSAGGGELTDERQQLAVGDQRIGLGSQLSRAEVVHERWIAGVPTERQGQLHVHLAERDLLRVELLGDQLSGGGFGRSPGGRERRAVDRREAEAEPGGGARDVVEHLDRAWVAPPEQRVEDVERHHAFVIVEHRAHRRSTNERHGVDPPRSVGRRRPSSSRSRWLAAVLGRADAGAG